MSEKLTVYNCSPAPRGYSHGPEIVRLPIGSTEVKREGLVTALHRPKSDLKALMDQGLLRLDGFYPSQVFRPKKVATTGPDIVIEDPAKPTPTPEITPLYSTQAPCAKMRALYEATRPGARRSAPKAAFEPESEGDIIVEFAGGLTLAVDGSAPISEPAPMSVSDPADEPAGAPRKGKKRRS